MAKEKRFLESFSSFVHSVRTWFEWQSILLEYKQGKAKSKTN